MAEIDADRRRLKNAPAIGPTITREGDANGAPHPDAAAYAGKFVGQYVYRMVEGNLPQEAPDRACEGRDGCRALVSPTGEQSNRQLEPGRTQ